MGSRWRSSGRRRSTTHSRLRAAAQRRMADGGFLASRGMTACRQGKKVSGRRCGLGDRGAAVLRPDQAIRGGAERACPGQPGERDVAACAPIEQEADRRGRRMTCTDAQTAASARHATRFARFPYSSRVLEINRRRSFRRAARSWSNEDRCADGPIHACTRRGQSTFSDLSYRAYRLAPACPGSIERGVACPCPCVMGSSPKGRNGEAGSSAAEEPGPQGDAPVLV